MSYDPSLTTERQFRALEQAAAAGTADLGQRSTRGANIAVLVQKEKETFEPPLSQRLQQMVSSSTSAAERSDCADQLPQRKRQHKRPAPVSETERIGDVNAEAGDVTPTKRRKLKAQESDDVGSWVRLYFNRTPTSQDELGNGKFDCLLPTTMLSKHNKQHPIPVSAPISNVTTNFKKHLLVWHPKEYAAALATVESGNSPKSLIKQQIEAAINRKNNPDLSKSFWKKHVTTSTRAKASNDLLLLFWIVRAGLPFNVVEDPLFRQYQAKFDAPLISRRSLVRLIPVAVDIIRQKLRATDLRSISCFAATTDAWSDACWRSYLAITYHFLDDSWNLRSLTLDVFSCPVSHTADNIAAIVRSRVNEWMPTNAALVALLSDGAAAFRKAAKELVGEDGLWCLAHMLQLVIKDFCAEADVEKDVERIRQVVVYQRNSTACLAALDAEQEAAGVSKAKCLSLVLDVPTRFSSTYFMLDRALTLFPFLKMMALNGLFDKVTAAWPDDSCISRCKALCVIMRPFVELTTKVSGDTYPTLSRVPEWLWTIKQQLVPTNDDSVTVSGFKALMQKHFQARLDPIFCTATTALCAASMDPRFVSLPWCSPEVKASVRARLEAELIDFVQNSNDESSDDSGNGSNDKMGPAVKYSDAMLKMSLVNYFEFCENNSAKFCGDDFDVLQWWKLRGCSFSGISIMAKALLCIPATSIPSERAFSSSGFLFNQRRRQMSEEMLEHLVFIRENCADASALLQFAEQYAPTRLAELQEIV